MTTQRTAPYVIAPETAGARITWTHFDADGSEITRTGTVWDLGPVERGQGTLWVIPDARDFRDGYSAVLIEKAPKRGRRNVGAVRSYGFEPRGGRLVAAGEWFAEWHSLSVTGSRMTALSRTPSEQARRDALAA